MSKGTDKGRRGAVQTTGHAWDGDIQEYTNPLPRWWLWAFFATVVFAVIYWVIYPAWPVADTYTRGILNTITYEADGETRTTHWNTRARLLADLETSAGQQRRQEFMERVAEADYGTILSDPEMAAFTRSLGGRLFDDNCAACHGRGGTGRVGLFPSLADDAWLWGGRPEHIETTIAQGRRGYMPAFEETFDEPQLEAVATFVLSLSGHEVDPEQASRGAEIFRGDVGGCYMCHTEAGTGRRSQGAADLTDRIWTVADVPGAEDLDARRAAVERVIRDGVQREMPGWKRRFTEGEIKMLTAYVHSLGGGM